MSLRPLSILFALAAAITLGAATFMGTSAYAADMTPEQLEAQIMDSSEFMASEPPVIDPAAPLAQFDWMQYKFFRAPDGYTAGIWAQLDPETTTLPVTVQLAVPEGADIFFFGPIPETGITPESPRFANYHVYNRDGLDIYTAVLTDSYEVQIEHYFWGESFPFPVRTLENGDHVIRISYTPLADVPVLRLAAFLPAGSVIRDTENVEFLGTGPTGDPAYAQTFTNVQGMQSYTTEIEYIPAETTARENQQTIGGGIFVVIAAAVGSIIVVLALLMWMQRRKRA
ncbi:MAG: hypothetical protein FWE46_06060 [Coriobacteriia bacterium]|nr:hypothetical protein [Coriobacteriia bacterium]